MTIRVFLLIFAFACECALSLALPVSQQEALHSAQQFLLSRTQNSRGGIKDIKMFLETQTPAFYIFNTDKDCGWVIVSADDQMPTILAYSDESRFYANDMPESLSLILSNYEQLASIPAFCWNREKEPTQDFRHAILPLLTTKWGQRSPYNFYMPTYLPDSSSIPIHYLTGCTTTAVAQLMYYHKWPQTINHEISYRNETLPPTTIDWDIMKDFYEENDSSNSAKEVAKLMKYISWGQENSFFQSGTGGFPPNMLYCLAAHMNYSNKLADTYWHQETKRRNDVMDNRIYHELTKNRPVLMTVGLEDVGMHEIVVDGFQPSSLYHMNFGWNGKNDGYYYLNDDIVYYHDESPSTLYPIFITFGVQPPTEGEALSVIFWNARCNKTFSRSNEEESFWGCCIENVDMINTSCDSQMYDIGIRIFRDEEVVDSVWASSVFLSKTISDVTITFPWKKELKEGTYTLRFMSRLSGTEKWIPDVEEHYIVAILQENTLYMLSPKYYEEYMASISSHTVMETPRGSLCYDLIGRPVQSRKGLAFVAIVKNAQRKVFPFGRK